MKNTLILTTLMAALGFESQAQTNIPVKGSIDIKFTSRNTTPPEKKVLDV